MLIQGMIIAMACCMLAPACFADANTPPKKDPVVVLQTNKGKVSIRLNTAKAPKTVENFLRYVKEGFYDGTVFHRVIPEFMIQGGGFTKEMSQKPTHEPVKNEADNGLANKRGTISMARTSDPNSATAQFFINVVDNPFLNYKSKNEYGYAVFGEVTDGMDVVDAIRKVSTGNKGMHQNVPVEAVIIEKAYVMEPGK